MVILIVRIFSFRYEKFDKGGFSETKDSDVENWIHPGWYTSREICRPRRRWMKTRLWECFLSWRSVEGKSDVLNLKLFYVISRDNSGWWRWVVRIFADAERFAEEGEMNSNSTASRFVHVDDDITSITYTYEEYQNTAFVNDTFIHSNESLPPLPNISSASFALFEAIFAISSIDRYFYELISSKGWKKIKNVARFSLFNFLIFFFFFTFAFNVKIFWDFEIYLEEGNYRSIIIVRVRLGKIRDNAPMLLLSYAIGR